VESESTRRRLTTRDLAISAVLAALVCVATMLVQIPNPPTRGYINVGDAMIFVSALTFGMVVGGFAGGVGSALADILSGYTFYAPFTLVIKGMEGLLAGFISDRKRPERDLLAVIVGGSEMVLGYFLVEANLFGMGAALTEVPGNLFQILIGGLIGIPVAYLVRRRLPAAYRI